MRARRPGRAAPARWPGDTTVIADSSFSRLPRLVRPRPRRAPRSSSRARASGTWDQSGRRAFSSVEEAAGLGPQLLLRGRAAAPRLPGQVLRPGRSGRTARRASRSSPDLLLGLLGVAGLQRQVEELEPRRAGSRAPPRPAGTRPRRRPAGPAGGPARRPAPVEQPPAVLPREGSEAPASSFRAGTTCGPPRVVREPHPGQPQVDPVAELLAGPVQQPLRPRRISSAAISSSASADPGPGVLGEPPAGRLQLVEAPSAASAPGSSSSRARSSAGSADPGAAAAASAISRSASRPLALRLRQPAVLLDQQRRQRQPRDPGLLLSAAPGTPGSPRRSRPGSISAWIHPSRATTSFGLALKARSIASCCSSGSFSSA